MAYWTAADIRANVWQVTANEVPDAIITQAIADGEAELHSYLEREYSVPFDTAPDLIKGLAGDIIRYIGQIRAGHQVKHLHEPDKEAYARATSILKDIRDGLMDIPGESRKSASADRFSSNTEDYSPIIHVDDEANWGVDDDRLEEIADDRS